MAYRIRFAASAEQQLAQFTARQQAIVLDAIKVQLRYEPFRETRNRKPMRPNPVAPWELRIQHLRVYYDVEEEPRRVVKIRAVGIKDRQRVLIGGEEVGLR